MSSVQWGYSYTALKFSTAGSSTRQSDKADTAESTTISAPAKLKRDYLQLSHLSQQDYEAAIAAAKQNDEDTVAEPERTSVWVPGAKTDKDYYAALTEFLGIGKTQDGKEAKKSSGNFKADLLADLKSAIKTKGRELQSELNALFKQNNISLGRHDRLTFRLDESGDLSVSGLKNQRKYNKVMKAVNSRPELLAELKSLAAKQQVCDAVQDDTLQETMQNSFALRRQLANDYLATQNRDASLADFELSEDASAGAMAVSSAKSDCQLLPGKIDGLDLEIAQLLAGPAEPPKLGKETAAMLRQVEYRQGGKKPEVDFAYKNGVLMNDTIYDREQVDHDVKALAMNPFPGTGTPLEHFGFTIIMSQNGSYRVDEVLTEDGLEKVLGDPPEVAFDETLAQSLVEDILMKHQYDYGDVDPDVNEESYTHEVKLKIDTGPKDCEFEIVSPGVEAVAEENIRQGMADFTQAIGQYLRTTFAKTNSHLTAEELAGILSQPLQFFLKEDGTMGFDESSVGNKKYADLIKETLHLLNERIVSDDPLADEEFESAIEDENLQDALNAMVDVKHNLGHLRQKQKRQDQTEATIRRKVSESKF